MVYMKKIQRFNPSSAALFLYNVWGTKGFIRFEIIVNVLSHPFLIHLNNYVMGLRPL